MEGKERRKIRYFTRGVRGFAIFQLLLAIYFIVLAPIVLANEIVKDADQFTSIDLVVRFGLYFIIGIGMAVTVKGLFTYQKWAWFTAIGVYLVLLFTPFVMIHFRLIIVMLAAYYLGNKRARAGFFRPPS